MAKYATFAHIMIYEQLEQYRKAAKKRKSAISEATNIPTRRIGEIFKGVSDPRVDELQKICACLGVQLVLLPENSAIVNKQAVISAVEAVNALEPRG